MLKTIPSTTPTCIEICSGAGGQALGLEMAGFGALAHVENDKHACATLRQTVACCLRCPRRKRGSNLLAAPAQYPNAVQTLNPAAGQRGRSPEHAAVCRGGCSPSASPPICPPLSVAPDSTYRLDKHLKNCSKEPMKQLESIELFSGAGGLAHGLALKEDRFPRK